VEWRSRLIVATVRAWPPGLTEVERRMGTRVPRTLWSTARCASYSGALCAIIRWMCPPRLALPTGAE